MLRAQTTYIPPTYRVVCVGVDQAPALNTLRYAEKDAVDVARIMCGELGPVDPEDVILLTGATGVELRAAMHRIVQEAPTFLLFYFSGHGSGQGIALRDGLFRYDELALWLRAIGAEHSTTILDTCHSGSFIKRAKIALGAIDTDVLDLLANATPGNRVIASSAADRPSGEGVGVQNGHFTASLINAMLMAPGALWDGEGAWWLNDQRLYAHARRTLVKRWGQEPKARGLTGDFPFVRDHRVVYGDADIVGADMLGSRFEVSVLLTDRGGVPTVVEAEAVNRQGRRLTLLRRWVVVGDDVEVVRVPFVLRPERLVMDPASQIHLLLRRAAPVTWHVRVLDARQREFANGYKTVWHGSAEPGQAFGHQ